MAENEDDRMDELSISDVSSEIQKILDKVVDNLKERNADRSALPKKLPEMFPNSGTNIYIELSFNSASATTDFSAWFGGFTKEQDVDPRLG